MEYKKYKLGDICKIFGRIGFRGYTTEDLVSSPSNGAISLSPSNIVDGVMDLSKCTYISWEKYEESPEIKVAPNDIVIVKTGNSYGRTAIIRNVEHPMTLNPQFVVLKDIQINPVYLAYFLKTDEFQKQIYGIVGGSAIPTLSQEDLANLIVRVPNENTQNTIADILDSLDGKIEINKRINDNLEAMAKQLYDYWFVQFDFPNEEGKPYKSSGGAMVWNEKLKREIPEGWKVANVFDELSIQYGFPFSTELFTEEPTNIPVVRIRDILDNSVSAYSEEEVDEKYKLQKQDLLVGMDGNFHMNYWNDNVSYLNQRSVRLRAKSKSTVSIMQAKYDIAPYIKAKELRAKGSTVGHLSDKDLKELFVLVCPNIEFRNKFDSILAEIIENRCEMIELTKQRDELLPLLMNGQATVNYHLSASTSISFDISVLFLNFTNGNSLYETISLDYQCFALPLHSKENTHGTIQEDKRHIQQRQRQGD